MARRILILDHIQNISLDSESEYLYNFHSAYQLLEGFNILIISKEEKVDFFALTPNEKTELSSLITVAKGIIESEYHPDGYNIGMNCGAVAGQTVMHFHCHVIPRYEGDMDDPRGGVRHCVYGKGYY